MRALLIGSFSAFTLIAFGLGAAALLPAPAEATTVTDAFETVGIAPCIGHTTIAGVNTVTLPAGRYEVSTTIEAQYRIGATDPGDPASCTSDCGVPLYTRVVYDRPFRVGTATTTVKIRAVAVGRVYFCPIAEFPRR